MNPDIDQLTKQFEQATKVDQRVNIALRMSAYYRTHSKEDMGMSLMTEVLEEVQQCDYQLGIGKVYQEISLLHYSRLALDKALDFSFQALTIFKTRSSNRDISEILCNMGVFYNALNLEEKGKEHFIQSIRYNAENIPPVINLGEYFVRQENHSEAIQYFQKAIKLSLAQEKNGDLAFAYKSMGEAHNALQQYNEAIQYFEKALEVLKELDEEHSKAFVFLGLSVSYLRMNENERALSFSVKALRIAEELDNSELFWFCYSTLADIYEQAKDYENAHRYQKLSLRLHEKLYSNRMTRRIAELEAVHRIEKNELETKRLLEKSARLASIGTMTAGITHEINQPLNSIVINSEGILFKDDRDKVLPDIYRDSVEKIFKSAQRIDQIIKHIRTYWNSSDDLIKSKAVNVNESIADALGFLNQQIRSHGIELQTAFSFENPLILGYKVHLEQIIVNLITNSIHALDKSEGKSKIIRIETAVENKLVFLRIEDNGIGLSESATQNIFDPFFSTKKTTGMGLGLSIVKNYVNQMNGEISFQNKESAGVVFTTTFPIYGGE